MSKAGSIYKAFCCVTNGSIAAAVRGRWPMALADHAQQIVLQDYIHAVQDTEARLDRLTRQIEELLPSWSMAPVVTALQAMRGVALVVAATVVAEVGDFRRFANVRPPTLQQVFNAPDAGIC